MCAQQSQHHGGIYGEKNKIVNVFVYINVRKIHFKTKDNLKSVNL